MSYPAPGTRIVEPGEAFSWGYRGNLVGAWVVHGFLLNRSLLTETLRFP